MNENGKSLELIKLLKVDEGKVAGGRMGRWAEAFEDWIEARRTRFSPNVGEDSYTAWREFLAFIRQAPWEVRVPDVEAYVEHLRARGLRPGTITKRLTGLSKFYEHCQQKGIDPECEAGFNPVAGARRPKVEPYEGANYLSGRRKRRCWRRCRRIHRRWGSGIMR